jgi:hypothetical protein
MVNVVLPTRPKPSVLVEPAMETAVPLKLT